MNILNTMTRVMMGMPDAAKFLGGALVCSLLAMQPVQADKNKQPDQWTLPADLLQTSNQISFNQSAKDAWFFMESRSLDHNVLGYRLLPNYAAVCPAELQTDLTGLACWWDTLEPSSTTAAYPHVGINFNDHDVNSQGRGIWPAKTLVLHPQLSRLAIIAWRNPGVQQVNVFGKISSLYSSLPCGDGVRWSLEKGTTVLASGDTAQAALNLPFTLKHLMLEAGETLYLIADPKTSDYCDSTTVSLTIN